MCSVGYSPKAVLRILKQPKSRDGVKSHYYKGLFTNYVDKILAFSDNLPPYVYIFYGMNVDKKWAILDHPSTSSCKVT